MSSLLSSRRPRGLPAERAAGRRRMADGWAMAALLLAAASFLFVDRRALPIELWDESRNIVNALEMRRHGVSLVTTYGGRPDLWNTKPPLAIWLMWAAQALLGPSIWALRLPSMLAALATALIVMLFVRRVTRSLGTALLAAALLVLSPAMFGEHSARTADYDAVLLMFTTGYQCLLFGAIHRTRPGRGTLRLAGFAIVGAVLTKGVAGVMPGAGVAAYALVTRRIRRVGDDAGWMAMVSGVAATVILFLVAREAVSGGYLSAMWHNDVAGRFARPLVTAKPWTFYLTRIAAGYFSAPLLLVCVPLGFRFLPRRARLLLLYSLISSGTLLVVATLAASKLHHYILPAMPFMAIAAALTARGLLVGARQYWRTSVPLDRLAAVAGLLLVGVSVADAAVGAIERRYVVALDSEGARSGAYGALFEKLSANAAAPVTVVDTGFRNDDLLHYTPVLRAYRLLWAARGFSVAQWSDPASIDHAVGVVASCDADIVPLLLLRGRDIADVPQCAAIRRQG